MPHLPRVLYVPNEIGDALQSGYRRGFADLLRAGLLSEVQVVSLQKRIAAGGDPEAHRQDLLAAAERSEPDILLMQHVGTTGLGPRHLEALRRHAGAIVYHEADPYSRFLHPLPRSAATAGRFSDVVHTVGAGVFADNFRRAGARDVRWTPHVFDPARIDEQAVAQRERADDVVVIANRNRPRLRPLPSASERAEFVKLLEREFGDAVAVYGRGWDGPAARGPVAYSAQAETIRSAWVSANWDHFAREPRYFSDRLPISLATGSIHATTEHAQYDEVFPSSTGSFLLTDRTPRDLVRRIREHLESTTPDERLSLEQQARRFAWQRFRQDDHLVELLNSAGAGVDAADARSVWDVAAEGLSDE